MTATVNGWLPKSILLLRDYDRHKFLSDLLAGVTVGLVALPLAMAFAIASVFFTNQARQRSVLERHTLRELILSFLPVPSVSKHTLKYLPGSCAPFPLHVDLSHL